MNSLGNFSVPWKTYALLNVFNIISEKENECKCDTTLITYFQSQKQIAVVCNDISKFPFEPVGDNFWRPRSNIGDKDQISKMLSLPFEQTLRTVFSKLLFYFISLLM